MFVTVDLYSALIVLYIVSGYVSNYQSISLLSTYEDKEKYRWHIQYMYCKRLDSHFRDIHYRNCS